MSWFITGTEKNPVDPYFSNVSLLLHGDGTNGSTSIIDSSPSPKTVTAYGDAQISTAVADPFGNSTGVLAFNGNVDHLTVPATQEFVFGTGDFTIEFWHRPLAAITSTQGIASNIVSGSSTGWLIQFNYISNTVRFSFLNWYTYVINQEITVDLNAWTHYAIAKNNGITKAFQNGLQIDSSSVNQNYTDNHLLLVGKTIISPSINGYIDDLRITKGIARYTSNFTPPTAPFPNA